MQNMKPPSRSAALKHIASVSTENAKANMKNVKFFFSLLCEPAQQQRLWELGLQYIESYSTINAYWELKQGIKL